MIGLRIIEKSLTEFLNLSKTLVLIYNIAVCHNGFNVDFIIKHY